MDNILESRIPKGGGVGKGFKSGGYGGISGGGGTLPLWAKLVIIFSILWLCIYVGLFIHFMRKAPEHYYSKKATERPRTCVALVGRPAWKAFKYATLIQAVIWAVRKAGACCATGRRGGEGTKKVGGTFYRKVADEERGVRSEPEPIGIPVAKFRRESPVSPISPTSNCDSYGR